ncbi:MAG: hypothetical protein HEQ39_11675 [Rhizobacter sp.]
MMQLAKPVSLSVQPAAVVPPSAAASLSTSATTTTPFATLLESQQGDQKQGSFDKNTTGATEDRSIARQSEATDKPQEPSKAPANERTAERQLERNRLNAQREARQLTNRPVTPHPSNKDTAQQTAAPEDSTATDDTDKDKNPPAESEFNPLTLLQWISDQAAQPALVPNGAAVPQDTVLPGSVFSNRQSTKTAADNPAALTSLSVGEKTPGARGGFTGKVPPASGLLMSPSGAESKQEPSSADKFNANAVGMTSALTAGAIGLDGSSRAQASSTTEVLGTVAGAVQKSPPSAGASEVNGSPQAFTLGAKTSALADSVPVSVNLSAPVQSPEFRELLGSQISLLAKDGVQSAELHLNPAEMGPVSVQITLDGTQARVDFGADSAQTRQFIEASLPELATALRDAGLTLSGGGVSQHAHGRENQQDSNRTASRTNRLRGEDAGDVAQHQPVSTRRVVLGGVDVYA